MTYCTVEAIFHALIRLENCKYQMPLEKGTLSGSRNSLIWILSCIDQQFAPNTNKHQLAIRMPRANWETGTQIRNTSSADCTDMVFVVGVC
jgi:hypothetical protein